MKLNMNNTLHNSSGYVNINMLDIDDLIMLKKKQKYLDMHPYAIWQSKNGKYWYTTLPDKTKPRGIRQIRRNSKNEIEDSIVDFWENYKSYKTVQEIFEEWNDNRLETKKVIESTYLRSKYLFKAYFGEVANKPISSFKPIDWNDFLESLVVSRNLLKDEFSHIKGLVTSIIRWSYKREYVDYPSSAVTDLLEISNKAFRTIEKTEQEEVFSEEETPVIMRYLEEHRTLVNLGILLMFVTGIRIGELMVLRHGDFVGNILRISRTRTLVRSETGNTGWGVKESPKTEAGFRDIIVPTNYQWLMDYFTEGEPNRYIFLSKYGTLKKHSVFYNAMKKVCADLNIPYRTPHKIRKTYTSILLENNVDTRFVMEQVGHSDYSCTENFYHKDRKTDQHKKDIINGIPDFKNITET